MEVWSNQYRANYQSTRFPDGVTDARSTQVAFVTKTETGFQVHCADVCGVGKTLISALEDWVCQRKKL